MSKELDDLVKAVDDFSKMPKEQRAKFRKHLMADHKKLMKEYRSKFYNTPEKFMPIDDVGDLYMQWFFDRYAALRMLKNMPIFDRAFKLLTERGNFSRKNAFGEMHGDGFLWVEKHAKSRVIVEERQSYKHIYIYDGYKFHIRALNFELNYPAYRKYQLKGINVSGFKRQGFKPHCPDNVNTKRFGAFTYGDARDDGYILSMDLLPGMEKIEYASGRTLGAIESIKYWEFYLDDPEQLE